MAIVTMRLVIDVSYRLTNGARVSELEKALSNVAISAASSGDFVRGTDAEVKTWGWKVLKAAKQRSHENENKGTATKRAARKTNQRPLR